MKATDIKTTEKTIAINEVYSRSTSELIGFMSLTLTKNNTHGGCYKYYNVDGSLAYQSEMEGNITKRVFYKGEWI